MNNFSRHLETFHAPERTPLAEIQTNRLSNQLKVANLRNKLIHTRYNRRILQLPKSKMLMKGRHANKSSGHQDIRERLQNTQEMAPNLAIASTSTSSSESDVAEWREKAQQLQKKLDYVQVELEVANAERRELLHKVLDLQGRARVMCRFRPSLNAAESANEMKIQISPNRNKLTCKCFSELFVINMVLTKSY